MRDITDILARLEAMARAGLLRRADADRAKRYVLEHAGEFLSDETRPASVGVMAERAVRAVGVRL